MLTLVPEAIEHYSRRYTSLRDAHHGGAARGDLRPDGSPADAERSLGRADAADAVPPDSMPTRRRGRHLVRYASLWIAGGLAKGGKLVTLDINEDSAAIARRHWREAEHGERIELRLGPAADSPR